MPKRKQDIKTTEQKDDMQLPMNELVDGNDITDSEESEYSGLEAEESTSEEDHENGFLESDDKVQNVTESGENNSNDSDVDENQSDSSDDDNDSNIVNETNEVGSDNGADDELSDDGDDDDDEQEIFVKQVTTEKVKAKIQKHVPKFEDVDTSDEEDIRNTVGNIPMEWYDDYKHFGYDIHGKKLVKSKQGDQLDQFLSKMEDPDYWRTVHDKTNLKEIKLTDDEIDMIQRIQNGRYTDSNYDPYEPYVDWFTGDTMVTPIKDNPASKNSFIPSKWEHKKVIKIVRAIRNGWIKPKTDTDGKPKYYLLWGKDDTPNTHPMHWPAPKLKLPGHEESYNPPSEYLPTQEEIETWQNMDPEDRPTNFVSKKYDSLRKVPGYSNFIQEKFERCLDLYLCPRQRKVRLQINPEDLIPKLPRPKDLQPFPTTEYIQYLGHEDAVRCISVDPTGQWLASGSSDKTIRFWEIATGRCMKTISMNGTVHSVQWNPQETLPMLAASVENMLLVINPGLGDKLLYKNIDNVFTNTENAKKDTNELVKWLGCSKKEKEDGIRIKVEHKKAIKQVTWHIKGDYIATVMPEGENKSVVIHQLTKGTSQCPFKKSKGQIQCVKFHPHRPFFFVATQRYVRVYNLQKQELTKKLMTGVKWISSLDIHPKGDNLIIGSYDKRLCWFDMDLSSKPYKTLRHHKRALRQVSYHKNYPLFASSSDDGTVIVCHGTVYNDLMQNPLIVPLKILRGHKVVNDLGVIDCTFHPHQPWIFTAGVDKTIRLFT